MTEMPSASSPAPADYAVITRDLTRRFGNLIAVNRLNLKVASGSIFGLIGPNGAGKTTTLRMLAGLLEPNSGEIRINHLTIQRYRQEIQWQIGYMPDSFGVYDDLLVWEYLDFYARCYRLAPERRARVVDELLELVGLSDKRQAFVETLSRGMRQRLCLAHALVHDPQVLLLDEPASGLDPRARVEMRELLRELRLMGKTIIVSSHILSELAELCDTVGILNHGQLLAHGTLADLKAQLADRFDGHHHRTFKVRALDPAERLETLLSQTPGLDDLRPLPEGGFQFETLLPDEQIAALIERLVAEKIRLVSFAEESLDLEELYLRLTAENEPFPQEELA